MDAMEVVLMAVTFLAGAKGDLLDTMTTDQYWKAKQVAVNVEQLKGDAQPAAPAGDVEGLVKALQSDDFKTRDEAKKKLAAMGASILPALQSAAASKDPEVALVAAALIEQFSKAGHAQDVRRLMAIRTLGERKEASALELVQGMAASKEPFVAGYARRAAAQIQGGAMPTIDGRKTVAADAWLLPRDVGMVIQGTNLGWGSISVEALAEGLGNSPMQRMRAMQGGAAAAPKKEELEAKATQKLLVVAERVGDFRIDGMTIALSGNFDGDTGWCVTVIEGEYDPAALMAAFKGMAARGEEKAETAKVEGADAISVDEGMLVMPSSERLVIVYAEDAEERAKQAEGIMKAIKTGKGTLDENGELAKMLKGVDGEAVAWGVSSGMESLKKEPMFSGFDQLAMTARRGDKKVDFVIAGKGSDAERAKASQETLDASIKAAVAEMQAEAQNGPEKEMVQPLLDTMTSIKAEVTGAAGKMTGSVPAGIVRTILSEILSDLPDSDEEPAGPAVPRGAVENL
jgi:hypothetical protein